VVFEEHSLLGAGCIVLPGVVVGNGSAIGALSLITKNVPEWGIYAGSPLRFIKNRDLKMLDLLPIVYKNQML
jgi:galactoside O-acetyltransferase